VEVRSAKRLYDRAGAERWGLSREVFRAALERSAAHHFGSATPSPAELDRYLKSLHLDDLALASACAAGLEPAWDHFVREFRPALYRAADAVDPGGGAREIADSLYGELFGVRERDGERQSLFRYFHGRSALATWLRAVVSQRFVDRVRVTRRFEPLPDADTAASHDRSLAAPLQPSDGDRDKFLGAVRPALASALAALAPRDRLRLTLYYVQQLTLAAIGRLLREHEGTVSRHLTRTRGVIRLDVENRLRAAGFTPAAIGECFEAIASDPGPIDLHALLATSDDVAGRRDALDEGRKEPDQDRSR
jgi:RNA polymerase sigma-70 factor, ECF subfamily